MANRIKSPGVYMQEEANTSLTAAQETLRTVAIVGTGPAYITQRITVTHISGETTDTIPGIAAEDIISFVGLYLGDVQIPITTKYTQSGVTITWVDQTYADRLTQYTAIVKTTKTSDYYEPKTWYTYDATFTDAFGYPVIGTDVNPIGAAAYLAFDTNAGRVITVQATSSSNTDIKAAIDKLDEEQIDYLIVPEANNSTLQTYIKDHVDTLSSTEGRMERKAWVAPLGITDSIEIISAQAESFADQRMWVLAPGGVTMTLSNGSTDSTLLLSSIYAGASLAGRLADPTKRIAKPLTRESVTNVDSVNVKYKKVQKETLAGSGVCVLAADAFGTVKVHQALTSDVSNYNNMAISIVNIKDEVRKTVRDGLDAEYIGQELDSINSPAQVEASITTILDSLIGTLLTDYANIVVELGSDGSSMNVSFDISVYRPFDYINITFKVVV